jgi:hypothetical protein
MASLWLCHTGHFRDLFVAPTPSLCSSHPLYSNPTKKHKADVSPAPPHLPPPADSFAQPPGRRRRGNRRAGIPVLHAPVVK